MARVKYYDHQSEQWKYADTALGIKGDPGKTPEKGVDYFTEEDKQEMIGRLVDEGVLTYNEQELTEEQKAQARENIGIDQISFDKLTDNLDASGFRITNLPRPQSGSEPATKEFVENFTIEGSTYVATDDGEGNVTIRPYLADEDELVFKSHIQNQNNPHNVTAAQVGAVTQQDIDTAKEEAKTYTNAQVKKAAPRNLLDNSDFRNPVNQRGSGVYTSSGYGIDRWAASGSISSVTVSNGYVIFTSTSDANQTVRQFIPDEVNLYGKTVTLACETTGGVVRCATGVVPDSKPTSTVYKCVCNIGNSQVRLCISATTHNAVQIYTPNDTVRLRWIALYEGEYTEDTLPEYQSKGYGAELLECQRYYQKYNSNGSLPIVTGISTSSTIAVFPFTLITSMRVAPSITFSSIAVGNGTGTAIEVTSLTLAYIDTFKQKARLNATVTGQTAGSVNFLFVRSGGYIEFSADL